MRAARVYSNWIHIVSFQFYYFLCSSNIGILSWTENPFIKRHYWYEGINWMPTNFYPQYSPIEGKYMHYSINITINSSQLYFDLSLILGSGSARISVQGEHFRGSASLEARGSRPSPLNTGEFSKIWERFERKFGKCIILAYFSKNWNQSYLF